MFIKSVILEGFKSYGKRTEIHGFDPEFTAITGLNGTGKSNILDAICFALGLTKLESVRAANYSDLVYKGSNGNTQKATVTLIFDNSNPDQCPMGYEKCLEISVTRQIVIDGKNKCLINGKIVTNKKIDDMFLSVQLNIHNPNFLIMQGRITKVLNMKPAEILSMIEEAAGTSIYEAKRDATTKLIEKKDLKMRETNTILKEEIEPKLDKLRKEHSAYIEFQKICRDIEFLTRLYVSKNYLNQVEAVKKAEKHVNDILQYIEESKQKIIHNKEESTNIEKRMNEIQEKISVQSGGELQELESLLQKKVSEEAQFSGKLKAEKAAIDQEKKQIKSLVKSIKDDEDVLMKKELQMQKVQSLFQNLKDADEADANAYADAQKRFEAVTQGLSTNEDGEASSLQEQLMAAKQQIIESETTIKQSEMELKHTRNVLKQKSSELKTNDAAYLNDKKLHDQINDNINSLNRKLSQINYEDGRFEQLEEEKKHLSQQSRQLQMELDRKNAYQYELQYRDPEPNFDRSKVHGMVGKLFTVRNERDYLALMMCAGGSIYSYVVEDEVTGKKILKDGDLKRRVTIIPMNKISSKSIPSSAVQTAERLVGRENAAPALSLIDYDPRYETVMRFVFGRAFICKNLDVAKRVTYNDNIRTRSVTLEGDVVDPEGTLSGGSAPKGPNVLRELAEIRKVEDEIRNINLRLKEIRVELSSLEGIWRNYDSIKKQVELRQHELEACSKRLAQSEFQQNKDEIESLRHQIETLEKNLITAREKKVNASKKVQDTQDKLADAKGFRERELKAANDAMKAAKEKSERSRENWKKREEEYETLKLEMEEIRKGMGNSKKKLDAMNKKLAEMESKTAEKNAFSEEISSEIANLKENIKQQKDRINAQSKELKQLHSKMDKLEKQNSEIQLELRKKENELTKAKGDRTSVQQNVESLEEKYPWIIEDREYFGLKNTRYDYSKADPEEAGRKLMKMKEKKAKMERNLNLKAISILTREEEAYKETIRKKKIVEEDKEKIKNIICRMDEQKKSQVDIAWQTVTQNFSSIFSTLLPGAQACLKPVYKDGNNLSGLEIKVGFNGVWKDSLGELSGGQRSLIALSLVLAMLKFSPAPLYILDEVDAALDMSHTQNIGNMLKTHFTNSQFIIVSLKDGMFNNANVLFRTKFEEGASAVTRTVNPKLRR